MQWELPRAHRLARVNYLTRTGSFAFSFLIILALLAERGYDAGTMMLAVLTLLAYPQLAYLHARLAVDSKRAEFRNLAADAVLMGVWAAQMHFALWPVCGALVGVCLNNACAEGFPGSCRACCFSPQPRSPGRCCGAFRSSLPAGRP